MILGRFGDTTGRPYVGGRLLLPRLSLRSNLSFLVDTGADRSTLMPADGIKMGLDYDTLTAPATVGGLGGPAACYQETAVLLFSEQNRSLIHCYYVEIIILRRQRYLMQMPSILGRDILDRWRMVYEPTSDRLTFTVRSAHHTVRTD